MKVWKVPFINLDNSRLVAQHRELHMLHSLLNRNPEMIWDGYNGLSNHQQIHTLHQQVSEEMFFRGFKHKTPITVSPNPCPPNWQSVPQFQRQPSPEEIEKDRWLLVCRWRAAGQGFSGRDGYGPHYDHLFERYDLQGGCAHELDLELMSSKDGYIGGRWELCLTCKAYVRCDNGPWIHKDDI